MSKFRGRVNGIISSTEVWKSGSLITFFRVRVTDRFNAFYNQTFPVTEVQEGTELKDGMLVSFMLIPEGLTNGTFVEDVAELTHKEIRLSEDYWWDDIGKIDLLPEPLKQLLRSMVSDTINHCIMPNVEAYELRLAKEYLSDTIICIGDRKSYSVMIYVPDDTDHHRYVFMLVPCYPGGELRRLKEF